MVIVKSIIGMSSISKEMIGLNKMQNSEYKNFTGSDILIIISEI